MWHGRKQHRQPARRERRPGSGRAPWVFAVQLSTFTVNPGDRLVFFTDGLLEARDRAGRFFRLEDCLDTLRQPDLQAAVDGLLSRLLAHTGGKLGDDVALLLLEATSPPARPEDGSLEVWRPPVARLVSRTG